MSVYDDIFASYKDTPSVIAKREIIEELKAIPAISEVFNNFMSNDYLKDIDRFEDVKQLDSSIYDIKDGIYRKKNFLISIKHFTPQSLKYAAMNSLGAHQNSKHLEGIGGKFLNIVTPINDPFLNDKVIYTPVAFNYILRDELFANRKPNFIFPNLILPHLLSEKETLDWVSISLEFLSANFFPDLSADFLSMVDVSIEEKDMISIVS
ncbi:TPA: hypothetical protein ACJEU7_001848 [Acinetobacter baumannii]|uniref:hypothetical protein n=1 Tax=Acinetobacter baumannii TaxID=470 RepID=UPI00225730C6|nr:hypothetical protein [Acinetobacter baumannii]MCX3035188.1 hypothetical protein [Acinetobacter baumannii]